MKLKLPIGEIEAPQNLYRCRLCGRTLTAWVTLSWARCSCGGRMIRTEEVSDGEA